MLQMGQEDKKQVLVGWSCCSEEVVELSEHFERSGLESPDCRVFILSECDKLGTLPKD